MRISPREQRSTNGRAYCDDWCIFEVQDDFNTKEGARIVQIATLFNLLTSWYVDKGSQLKWLKTAHPSFKNMLPSKAGVY